MRRKPRQPRAKRAARSRPALSLEALEQRITEKKAKIGIIGLGYVGLPLVLAFAEAGFSVIGFDIDEKKITKLDRGQSYIGHIPAERIAAFVRNGRFQATSDYSRLREVHAILICVPTPLDERRQPDLSYVEQTARSIRDNLVPGQLIVLESTTYPGTTEELVLPILEESGLECPVGKMTGASGKLFYLAFSPEREDPGNAKFRLRQIPKVIGGVNPQSSRLAQALYRQVVDRVVAVSSSRAAEMTKLLENIYRSVNIALVNELKLLCQRMGLDVWEVIEASSTKPFGFAPFYPGPGLGGHCIPVDPFYLSWKAREYDFATRFIELAGEVNTAMPYHVVERVVEALNQRQKVLNAARILVLGVAYKKDVDDLRGSPALKIIHILQSRGARVDYNDPHFPRLQKSREYDYSQLRSVPLERIRQYDCVLIVTDHSAYDYDRIVREAQLVVDTRNATRNVTHHREKIVPA